LPELVTTFGRLHSHESATADLKSTGSVEPEAHPASLKRILKDRFSRLGRVAKETNVAKETT